MANINYKKGELLFSGDITTIADSGASMGIMGRTPVEKLIQESILFIEFNDILYQCNTIEYSHNYFYGGFETSGPNFSKYPFICYTAYDIQKDTNILTLITENPGTYSLKIYTAIEDSDSSTESNQVIAYLMTSPSNTNWNVLSSIIGNGDWSKLKAYVETTPHNMNRMVLESLLSNR